MPDPAEIAIYKAWRNTLIDDTNITAHVPAGNIVIGPREANAPVPSIAISKVGEARLEKTHSAKVSGEIYIAMPTFQLEIAISGDKTMAEIVEISAHLLDNLLKDNATLNAAAIRNIQKVGEMEYRDERGLLCRAMRFAFNYMFKLS